MALSAEEEGRVAEEAASWLEKLDRAITRDESETLREWLKSSTHRRVIVERCKLWHGPEILAVLGELIPVETLSQRVERHYGRITLAIFLGMSGIGLATVLIALSKLWPGTDERQNPLRAEASIRTAVGERKTIKLPDGGSIILNTGTHVLLSYRPHSRDATLVRGEATFAVIDDPARPFLVFAGPRRFQVQAGGATFNVDRVGPDEVELTVMEGQVGTPESRSRAPLSPALLRARVSSGAHMFNAGEGGVLGAGWQAPRMLQPDEIKARTAWQRGLVVTASPNQRS